jgi:hypothetical protein
MLKQRLTLYLALTGSLLTVIIGLLNDVRLLTIGYRALVSMFIFALIGYVLGIMAEMFLRRLLADIKPKGQKIDITSEDNVIGVDYLAEADDTETEFRPLTPDNFNRISSGQ